MSGSGSEDVSHEDCSSVSLVQLGDVGPWLGTLHVLLSGLPSEAVKVGPTSEIEFKVQFERSGGCWQNLDLLGRGPSVRGAARGGDTPGKAGRGPLDVRAVAKFQTF